MALDIDNKLIDTTGEFIHSRVREQSWFQKNSNTVSAVGGFVATVLAWVASQPFAVDPRVQTGVLILGFLLTVFGVKKTPNGWSDSQVRKIRDHHADVVGGTKLAVPVQEPSTVDDSGAPDLDSQVSEFNQRRG